MYHFNLLFILKHSKTESKNKMVTSALNIQVSSLDNEINSVSLGKILFVFSTDVISVNRSGRFLVVSIWRVSFCESEDSKFFLYVIIEKRESAF